MTQLPKTHPFGGCSGHPYIATMQRKRTLGHDVDNPPPKADIPTINSALPQMLFGHKESFAIEAMIESELKESASLWGRMRVWCNGQSLGNYSNEHCGLPYEDFKSLRSNLPAYWSSEFTPLTDEDIFHRLDAAVFGCRDGVELSQVLPRNTRGELDWSAFTFLTNWEEMFDGEGKLFILSPDGVKVKVLHQPFGSLGCVSLTTTVSAVQHACDGFITWYNSEAAKRTFR